MNLGNIKIINILKIVVVIVSIIGGVWAFEDRYQTKANANEVQQQTVKTIDQLQQKINYDADVRLYDQLIQRKFLYKRLIKQNPNDQDLREEYQQILDAIKRVKERLEEHR
jgi:outer membrane PBP1 activator LpoA protein